MFAARATVDHTPVTLKVFLPDLMARADHQACVRALKEAAALHHASIDTPIDVASVADIVYTALADAPLPTLRDQLERDSRLSIPEVIAVGSDIASGLAFARRHGMVHADLTPRRIALSAPSARVTDMGFMRAVMIAVARSPHDSGLTLGSARWRVDPRDLHLPTAGARGACARAARGHPTCVRDASGAHARTRADAPTDGQRRARRADAADAEPPVERG